MKAILNLFSKTAVFQPRDGNTAFWSNLNRLIFLGGNCMIKEETKFD